MHRINKFCHALFGLLASAGVAQLTACESLSDGDAASAARSAITYDLVHSSFIGGTGPEQARGIATDAQGNTYIAGSTSSADFPTTPGVVQSTYAGGKSDAFICKFDAKGKLVWSTFLGGPTFDKIYTIKLARDGYIYVSGRGGAGFPTTPGTFQSDYRGADWGGFYGQQNGFVAKLTPDASRIVWASYVGLGHEVRDMALDDRGDLYMTLSYAEGAPTDLPKAWTKNAYHPTPSGKQDTGLIKVSGDGKKVYWATFNGGSADNFQDASLCVGPDRCPVLFMGTRSRDLPTTDGAFKREWDSSWLGKLSADGSQLIFGTYIGDNDAAMPRTHAAAIDSRGNIFVGITPKGDWPTTPNAYQQEYGGGRGDFGLAKFSPTGRLLAATYIGGSGFECNGPDTVLVDQNDNVLLVSTTDSTDYPVTPNAIQPNNAGRFDGVLSVLSNDLSTLVYSTYFGGNGDDMLRVACIDSRNAIHLTGCSGAPKENTFPVRNASQPEYRGMADYKDLFHNWASGDTIVLKIAPVNR